MKKTIYTLFFSFLILNSTVAQTENDNNYQNTAEKLITSDSKFSIGGYAEVHYNQILDAEKRTNGALDVHRMVMFFGYNFSDKTQFVTEVEFEYTNELWVEQLFLQQKLNRFMNLKAGLLLIPMGIINEHHEPTTFNGVERPNNRQQNFAFHMARSRIRGFGKHIACIS